MIKIVVMVAMLLGLIWVLAGPVARGERQKKLKAIEDRFGTRESLSADTFFERHFSSPNYRKEIVIGIRETMEQILDSDLSFLRDSDDFSKDLSLFWDFDSMANVELLQAIEDRFKIKVEDSEAEQTRTVRDLVDLVHAKIGTAT